MKTYREVTCKIYLCKIECTEDGYIKSSTHIEFIKKHPEYEGCKVDYRMEGLNFVCYLYREECTDYVERC